MDIPGIIADDQQAVKKSFFSRESKKSKREKSKTDSSKDPKKPKDPKKILPFIALKSKSKPVSNARNPINKISSGKLFDTPIGKIIKDNVTVKIHGKRKLYTVNKDINHQYLKKGDKLQLDTLHRDHIEVYDSRGKSKCVLNLDGTLNEGKTLSAQGRTID